MLLAIFCSSTVFAGARRGDDQHALTLANRRHQVDDPHVQIFRIRFKLNTPIGMQWRQVFKVAGVGDAFGVFAIDRFHAKQREIPFAFLRRANLPLNHMPVPQAKAAESGSG